MQHGGCEHVGRRRQKGGGGLRKRTVILHYWRMVECQELCFTFATASVLQPYKNYPLTKDVSSRD